MGATAARMTQGLQMGAEMKEQEKQFEQLPTGSVAAHAVALVAALRALVNCKCPEVLPHLRIATILLARSMHLRDREEFVCVIDALAERAHEGLEDRLDELLSSDAANQLLKSFSAATAAASKPGASN